MIDKNERIPFFDRARAIAIVSITFNHAANRSFAISEGQYDEFFAMPMILSIIRTVLYAFSRIGVPFFLMHFFTYNKDIIEYAKNHKDVTLLCRSHPMMFDNYIKTGEMLQEEVNEYKELINKTDNVKLNETKEYDAILWNSDVLISDLSSLMPEYFVTGKPIIYCTPTIELPMSPHSEKMLEGCYLADTKEEMFNYLEQLRLGNDPLKESRQRIIKEAFGEHIDKTSEGIIEILRKGR